MLEVFFLFYNKNILPLNKTKKKRKKSQSFGVVCKEREDEGSYYDLGQEKTKGEKGIHLRMI